MKIVKKYLIIFILFPSLSEAEPYAEWGIFSNGISLKEFDSEITMPEKSTVPIPPPPGAKFINISGGKYCTIGLRTELTAEKVCNFYETYLPDSVYSNVESKTLPSSSSCYIFKDSSLDTNLGVIVENNEDPMFSANGKTLVLVNYPEPSNGC